MKIFGYAVLMFSMVAAPAFAENFAIPKDAQSSGDLTGSSHWFWSHDSGTPGSSTASSHYPESNPSLDGRSREFSFAYSNKGGERFSLTFGHDAEVTHFLYDTYVWIENPSEMANLELDMNQVIPDGKTVIFGFQCSSYSNNWEYATVVNRHPHWKTTGLFCSPKKWAAQKWHHIQIASHRNNSGDVTYDWVGLDGVNKTVNKTSYAALSLHWTPGDLNLNFQIDGATSRGSVKMYADKLTIFYW